MAEACNMDGCSWNNCPSFFKVYLNQLSSKQLRIPPKFVQSFDGVMPNLVTLKDNARKCCQVEMEKIENNVFMSSGWQAFVKDHSIQHGDFLLFRYEGNSVFDVMILGRHGCIKDENLPDIMPRLNVKPEVDTEASEKPSSSPASDLKQKVKIKLEDNPCRSLCTRDSREKFINSDRNPSTSYGHSPYENTEIRMLFNKAKMKFPKNPLFIASVERRYTLNIPSTIMKEKIKFGIEGKVVIKGDGKRRRVTCIHRKDGRVLFSSGWMMFLRENKLGIEDRCVLECQIGREKLCKVIQAHIFRQAASKANSRTPNTFS